MKTEKFYKILNYFENFLNYYVIYKFLNIYFCQLILMLLSKYFFYFYMIFIKFYVNKLFKFIKFIIL